MKVSWVPDVFRNPCSFHAAWRTAGSSLFVWPSVLLLALLLSGPEQVGAAASNCTDSNQLVREVIQNEIQGQANNNNLWSYRELTKRKGKSQLLEYCQTKYGTIHRLLASNGQPLSPSQRQAEAKRIQMLIRSPDAMRAAERKQAS